MIADSDRFDDKGPWVPILYPLIAASFIGTGLFAWWRRPENRIGPLMTAVGFVWSLGTLEASDTPGIFIIGLIINPAAFAILIHMLLAFPSGRLRGRGTKFLVGVAYFDTLVLTIVAVLFHQTSAHSDYCTDCPPNPILISDQPGFSDFIFGLQSVLGTLGLAAIGVPALPPLARRLRLLPERGRPGLRRRHRHRRPDRHLPASPTSPTSPTATPRTSSTSSA